MRNQIVRLANYAHTIEKPFGRRALLALAVFGLCLFEIGKWICIVIFIPFYPFVCMIIGFCKAIMEIPPFTIGQAEYDADNWRRDAAGIARIWRSVKVEVKLERNKPGEGK